VGSFPRGGSNAALYPRDERTIKDSTNFATDVQIQHGRH
jgi:hypothetical protein